MPENFYNKEEYKFLKINFEFAYPDENFNTNVLSAIIDNNIELNKNEFSFYFDDKYLKLSNNYERDYPIIIQLDNFNETEIFLDINGYNGDHETNFPIKNFEYLKNFPS